MKSLHYTLMGVLGTCILLSSCFKRDNTDWTFEQDNAASSELFQDVYKQMDETSQSEGSLKSCATVTLLDTAGAFPNTVTVDFGTGCVGTDGRSRSGSLTATYTGRWRDAGTVVTITTTDYRVNGYAVSGTITITNNGLNSSSNLNYTVAVADGQIIDPNSNTTQWNGSTNYEMVAGAATDFASHGISGITDDIYHITGSANGVNRNGTPYTTVITEHLVRDLSCKWITDGVIELTPQNGDVRTLNFGDGACDANVSFTFKQWTLNFILP